jgi:tripartite-type tricarboxylate transporter receptor subunit TctC
MTTLSRRAGISLGAAALFGDGTRVAEAADGFPSKTIRFIVGYPPGGGADLVARALTPPLGTLLGQTCIVENRAGADGRIGADYVVRARPDGYTLLVTTEGAMVIAPHTGQATPYKTLSDLAPISLLTRTETMIVANPKLGVTTLQQLIAKAKAAPGTIDYGSSGIGGPNHLAAEVLQQKAGISLTHIPFKGTGEVIPAVLSGVVPVMFGYVPALAALVREKTVVPLAVCGASRSASLPDVPTVAESGIPDYRMESWMAAFAPAATPPSVIDRLQSAIAAALHRPETEAFLVRYGLEPAGTTAQELASFLKSEDQKYIDILKTVALK